MELWLKKLIEGGENQHLDFKFCVSDSRKIARSLVAFSNSDGGRLLIGVRDNGSIAGIRSDEEIYMVDTAAGLYCKPEIKYVLKQHITRQKTILEVEVLKGTERPYKVKDEDGKWKAYFRYGDKNLLANRILQQVWRKEGRKKGLLIKFGRDENLLLDYLKKNGQVTFSGFKKAARISSFRAEAILANLILLDVLEMSFTDKGCFYKLKTDTSVS
jgi:predicted HTH transcriptional regulator